MQENGEVFEFHKLSWFLLPSTDTKMADSDGEGFLPPHHAFNGDNGQQLDVFDPIVVSRSVAGELESSQKNRDSLATFSEVPTFHSSLLHSLTTHFSSVFCRWKTRARVDHSAAFYSRKIIQDMRGAICAPPGAHGYEAKSGQNFAECGIQSRDYENSNNMTFLQIYPSIDHSS